MLYVFVNRYILATKVVKFHIFGRILSFAVVQMLHGIQILLHFLLIMFHS